MWPQSEPNGFRYLAAALVDLGAITDDGDKDDLKGEQGFDELIDGVGDKLKS
jgi:hypothetical protein